MPQKKPTITAVLITEFRNRRRNNSRYSLRSFARHLQLSPASLSQVMSRKRQLSRKNLLKVVERLNIKLSELDLSASSRTSGIQDLNFHLIPHDVYTAMADWYHYAILCLADLKDNQASPSWIARKLGISEALAGEAVDRLARLKLIRIENNKLKDNQVNVTTPTDVPSEALKKYYRQTLDKVKLSLDNVDVADRDITSIMFPFDVRRMKQAKKDLKTFRRKFCAKYEAQNGNGVYTLMLNFIPVTLL